MSLLTETPLPIEAFSVPYAVRKFTVTEYRQMAEQGILTEDDAVELLEGWITPKMTKNPPHDVSVDLTNEALSALLPSGWRTRVQSAISASDSEPEPDVAVVRGPARRWSKQHPGRGDIALIVEVAETSLQRDRNKRRIYAREAISTYWIVNLADRQLEVYRDPSGEVQLSNYATPSILQPGDRATVTIDGQDRGQITVDDLLP